jgi:hypothetical protein
MSEKPLLNIVVIREEDVKKPIRCSSIKNFTDKLRIVMSALEEFISQEIFINPPRKDAFCFKSLGELTETFFRTFFGDPAEYKYSKISEELFFHRLLFYPCIDDDEREMIAEISIGAMVETGLEISCIITEKKEDKDKK